MKLTFHGGAKMVTGANYLLEEESSDSSRLKLVVDCGLFQGSKFAEDLNYDNFAYDPKEINYIFITHSHMDHVGRLPKLVKDGFFGTVYMTKPTRDLIAHALPDSLRHISDEAKRDGHPPLYEKKDVAALMDLIQGVEYDDEVKLSDTASVIFHDAGHILGSSIVEIKFQENGVSGSAEKRILFSGDLGNPPTPLLRPTEFVREADYVVIESAYGDRVHEDRERRKDILEDVIEETVTRGGTLMIPSFAMERTQELLYELNEMVRFRRIPEVPIFIDSPLAIKLTDVYRDYPEYFNKEVLYIIGSGEKLFKFPGLQVTQSVEESKRINDVPPPKIIIAGSGMSQGGRIIHHERRYLPDEKNTILFIAYQVKGSLGRRIQEGEKKVSIFGERVTVRCHIRNIGSYSAHADQPTLVAWVKKARDGKKLKKVFIVQGEENASDALAVKIRDELVVDAVVPEQKEQFIL